MATDDTTIEALQARIEALEERADEHDKQLDKINEILGVVRDGFAKLGESAATFLKGRRNRPE